MRSKSWIVFLMFFLLLPNLVFANEPATQIDQLNELSDEALQLTKSHRYEDAKVILEAFSEKFSSVTIKEQTFSMDELRIVTIAHNEAVEATTNATMDPEERINVVTKFRLVIDAISGSSEPLWTQMEAPVMAAYDEVKKAAINGEKEDFHHHLNSFLALYEMIHPSMTVDVPIEKIQQLDTRIQFIDQYRMDVLNKDQSKQELFHIESELLSVFNYLATEDETDPSLWWVIISTGSIIVLTLSYVGWRKYKGERDKSKNHSRQ
ncbi:sporulation protein YpjB [Niallia sp. Krafla_26]|uniref:sporulation protein YpjB n=1 Tax=Niallia sp. Krafla_26 TaxID=3064703 RepID=UPI003D167C80